MVDSYQRGGLEMGLYNSLFGVNPAAGIVVKILKAEGLEGIPRFRDAYVNEDENSKELQFVVFTRTGGGNREEYEAENDAMTQHPLAISNEDDDFDCTYAYFRFKVPEKYIPLAAMIYEKSGKQATLSDRFGEKLEDIKKMNTEDLKKTFPEIFEVLEKVTGDTKE